MVHVNNNNIFVCDETEDSKPQIRTHVIYASNKNVVTLISKFLARSRNIEQTNKHINARNKIKLLLCKRNLCSGKEFLFQIPKKNLVQKTQYQVFDRANKRLKLI
jgi:hypothetical protein